MNRQTEADQLSYWLAGLECGALEADEVSAELDALIVNQGEAVSPAVAEAAWRAAQGKNALISALRAELRDLHREPDAPAAPAVCRRLRRIIARKWQDGRWDMEKAVDCFYRLARCCAPRDNGTFVPAAVELCVSYDLALEGCGDMDRVVDLFLRLIHEEDA